MLTVAVFRFDAYHPGQQRRLSLFTLVAHLVIGVWLPTRVERVTEPRRRCPAATTSFDNGRKPGRTRDEYLSASSGVTTYAPLPTVLWKSCKGVASSADCCLKTPATVRPLLQARRDTRRQDTRRRLCRKCAAVSGLEATTFEWRVRTRTRITGHVCQTSNAGRRQQTAFPAPTLSPQVKLWASRVELGLPVGPPSARLTALSVDGGPTHGVACTRVHIKTSSYPRIRSGMDGIGQDSKWLRGRKFPSIQDAAPRYGRPVRRSMDVPGAGLFVALGTSTAVAGS
ncbi:hypothetical protein DICSQDRAFT_172610 [Dichomitus squalens LYAD-421 SS1]|uniref:Uncharacterized protein n=1 Tax=Dichomitus squalens (strain LYAD-421) TaxID=732165 RepID=R7SS69_DICSQ|nr:uncharacterized protein DICSQDRAFT_172610 [Dichomitus squalens LYAD-421 SS1]EJF58783.1 hypothetical protein DICSQDRAFT_172610 [Dichomitus squalens LYAD-421 SS1]